MSYPTGKEIETAILEELEASGKSARTQQLFPRITARFPQLTPEDLGRRDPSGMKTWPHKIHTAASRLRKQGQLRLSGGIWDLLKDGPPPPDGPAKIAEEIKGLVDKLAGFAKKQEEPPALNHQKLVEIATDLGKRLGKQVNAGWKSPYQHDCLWGDNPWANPSIAIEICDKGVLDKDIQSLHWAWDNWKALGLLVVVDDKEYEACKVKIPKGAKISAIKATDFANLHSLLQSAGKDAVVSIFGT
jgi:hypothetical protein